MILAGSAGAGGDVVLEVGVAAGDLPHALERLLGERCASEVRVDDHTGRVDDATEPRCACRCQLFAKTGFEVSRIDAGVYSFTRAFK